ncbi:pentatricopeptide repeat-containing protein At1g26460, mitochondrial-like [Apium graveolens]|uniref:pentatricopeptide repeat-containing protein At1g26460, mitochondrial-like n=1 Tax=Apium graveolens TaxID=4045 RepID=UPI003D78EF1F
MKNLNAFRALKPLRILPQIFRLHTAETFMHAKTPNYTASVLHVPLSFLVPNRRYSYGLISLDPKRELATECGRLSLEEIKSLVDDLMKKQEWSEIKNKFEKWVSWTHESCRTRNMPDLSLVNYYMRSRSMLGSSLKDMFVLLEEVQKDYHFTPDTLSYNIILDSAYRSHGGVDAAVKIFNWMVGEQLPKEESYTLVVDMLLQHNDFQSAMKYVKLARQLAYNNPMEILVNAVVNFGHNAKAIKQRTRIKAKISKSLVSIFGSYKSHLILLNSSNDALYVILSMLTCEYGIIFCPKWTLSDDLLQLAIESSNLKLARYALEFIIELKCQDEACSEPLHLCVSEDHINNLFVILKGSPNDVLSNEVLLACSQLRDLSLGKHVPKAITFLSEIHAWAHFKKLDMAFEALVKYETSHGESVDKTLFCPFSQLKPLVLACRSCSTGKISEILNHLEALRKDNPDHKFLAALNCLILVYAKMGDDFEATRTFKAISSSFGLTHDINSYNAIIYPYVYRKQRNAAIALFKDLVHVGIEPNAITERLMFKAIVIQGLEYAILVMEKVTSLQSTPEVIRKARTKISYHGISYSIFQGIGSCRIEKLLPYGQIFLY